MTLLQRLYRQAVIDDCDVTNSIIDITQQFPTTDIITLTRMADGMYAIRRDFLRAMDDKVRHGVCKSRNQGKLICPRCNDPYCSRAIYLPPTLFMVLP